MPWRMAFSTRGCSSSGGRRQTRVGFLDPLLHDQAGSEAKAFDGQVGAGHLQLFLQGHVRPVAQGQALAEELGEQDAHLPRARRVARGERADGVEAVEEEVRVDLRLEGLELGVAGEHAQLQGVLLGPAGSFLREQRVVEGSGQQIEERAPRQGHRNVVRVAGGQSGHGEIRGEQARQHAAEIGPGEGGEEHPQGVQRQALAERRFEGNRAADVAHGEQQAEPREGEGQRQERRWRGRKGLGTAGQQAGGRCREGQGSQGVGCEPSPVHDAHGHVSCRSPRPP